MSEVAPSESAPTQADTDMLNNFSSSDTTAVNTTTTTTTASPFSTLMMARDATSEQQANALPTSLFDGEAGVEHNGNTTSTHTGMFINTHHQQHHDNNHPSSLFGGSPLGGDSLFGGMSMSPQSLASPLPPAATNTTTMSPVRASLTTTGSLSLDGSINGLSLQRMHSGATHLGAYPSPTSHHHHVPSPHGGSTLGTSASDGSGLIDNQFGNRMSRIQEIQDALFVHDGGLPLPPGSGGTNQQGVESMSAAEATLFASLRNSVTGGKAMGASMQVGNLFLVFYFYFSRQRHHLFLKQLLTTHMHLSNQNRHTAPLLVTPNGSPPQ